jgi:hypothetical protein
MESDQSLGIEGERARVSRKFGMSELSRQKPPGDPSLPPLIVLDESTIARAYFSAQSLQRVGTVVAHP